MIHLPRHALMNDIAYLWYVHLFTLSILSEKTWVIYELKKEEQIIIFFQLAIFPPRMCLL